MNNQPYAAEHDKKQETRTAAIKLAEQFGRKEAEARKRSQEILGYYKNERKQR